MNTHRPKTYQKFFCITKKRNEFIKVTQRQQNRESVVTDVRREGVADSQTKENPASMGE